MKKFITLFLISFCLFSLVSCKEVTFDESKGIITVGLECDYAPFNWLETTKTSSNYPVKNISGSYAEGYDVQIAKLIAEELGYKLVLVRTVWDGLIEALDAGTIDLIIAGMSPTEERKLSISFSDAYYETTHVVLSKANSKYVGATTFKELAGAKIIGQKGTIYNELAGQVASKSSNCTHLTPLSTVPLIVNAINSGVADITILEEPVAKGLVARDSSLTYFKLNESFDLDESDTIVSIGLRKADTKLLEKVNNALSKITKEKRDSLMLQAINNQPIGE